jgi:ubiquinone/menaquinone biosynthesis C-methylase UbiE
MKFYEAIAHYYDDIFKLKEAQVEFAQKLIGKYDVHSLLDVGCSTGAFSAKISDIVDEVHAFDLDESMVAIASNRYKDKKVDYKVGDMLNISDLYKERKFDMITCFGNTLVHLNKKQVKKALGNIRKRLDNVLLMQILNYDYILDANIVDLPKIENEKIEFNRHYNLENPDKIVFETELIIKESERHIENAIYLCPIRKKELDNMLKKAGFEKVIFYRNYNGDGANGQHLPLIVVAR